MQRPYYILEVGISDIFKRHFLEPFFLKQTCYSFYHGSPDLKIDRKIRILMSDIDSCTDYEMNLITFHNQPDNLISRTLAKFDTIIIRFKYFVHLLKCKYSLGNEIDTFQETFRR